jgi:DeoR/GlpR family transcriptional regulator of sugar metabolism
MIVTNSLPLALALADHPAVSVRVLGGALLKEGRVTASTGTVNAIELVRADLCLLGMCGLHPETGITTSDAEEAHVKHAMISHAAETIGLISSGKLGTTMPYIVGPARLLSRIVTDTRDEAVLVPYTDLGLEIVTAG